MKSALMIKNRQDMNVMPADIQYKHVSVQKET
jgi:hypothetical protein